MRVGLLTASPTALLADLAQQAGADFLALDAEQTTVTPADCLAVSRQLRATQLPVLVRVPATVPDLLLAYANAGADELILPGLGSVEEVRSAARIVSWPPAGIRPRQFVAATGYHGRLEPQVRLSLIVETVAAVENLSSLIDCGLIAEFWIGKVDLAADLGARGDPRPLSGVVDTIVDTLKRCGVSFGLAAADTQGIGAARQTGAARCAVYWEPFILSHLGNAVEAGRSGVGGEAGSGRPAR